MVEVATLELTARTEGLKKAEAALDGVTKAAGRAENAAQDVTAATARVSGGMSAGAQQARMMAMQLSQVAQQASATGNFVQALAIQLPDMALGFGAVGIAAGIVASVALPAVANALFGAGEDVISFTDNLAAADDAIKGFKTSLEQAYSPVADLAGEFGVFTPELRSALQILAEIEKTKAFEAISLTAASLQSLYTETIAAESFFAQTQLFLGFTKNSQDARDAANEFMDALGRLNTAIDPAERLKAALDMAAQLENLTGGWDNMTALQRDYYTGLQQIIVRYTAMGVAVDKTTAVMAEMPGYMFALQTAANLAAGAVSGIGSAAQGTLDHLANVATALKKVADQRWAANIALEGMAREFSAGGQAQIKYGGRGAPTSGQSGLGDKFDAFGNLIPDKTGSDGGGGGADDFTSRLEALTGELQSEREVVDAWYADAQEILADRRAMEILGLEEHKAALLEVESLYQQQINEIEMQARDKRLGETADFFGAMASLAAAGGDKMVKAVQTFGAIEALINTYRAQAQVLADPTLGFWGKMAAYVKIGAAGLNVVKAIKGGGGGGGSGASAGSVGSASQANADPQRMVRINIVGDDPLTNWFRQNISIVAEALAEEHNIGGFVVG